LVESQRRFYKRAPLAGKVSRVGEALTSPVSKDSQAEDLADAGQV